MPDVCSRWLIDPLVTYRRLGEQVVAFHAGSGDTHLLSPVSGAILDVLSSAVDGSGGCSVADLLADEQLVSADASEAGVTDALVALAETEIVRVASEGE